MASQQAQQVLSGEGRASSSISLIERQVKNKWQKSNSAITRRWRARSAGLNAKCNRKTLFAKSNGMPSMFRPEKSAACPTVREGASHQRPRNDAIRGRL